jgi:mono/diheme cytochrome c family protein
MSRSAWKTMGWIFAGLLAAAVISIRVTVGWRPMIGPRTRAVTNRTFAPTPERLERGAYLASALTGCQDCHSQHDFNTPDAAVTPGRAYAGAEIVMKGLPGRVVAPNLTADPETGLGNWSDDEIARAIREGISRDGRALFPMMPYGHFRFLPDEDLASLIVFLRSLAPVRNATPKTAIVFPVNYLIRNVPQPIPGTVVAPDLSTPARRGAYLVEIAGCTDCHTPVKNGTPMAGMDFSGGMVLEGPWGRVASPNLTPDASGIAYYDEGLFVQAIRTGAVKSRPLNPIMPWPVLRNLTDQDLKDMFAYLQTLPPVQHRVDNGEAPTVCRICGGTHGLGDKN